MKTLFVLNYKEALVYDHDGLLIAAYQWPYGRDESQEAINAMTAMIDAQSSRLVQVDIMLYPIHLHHRKLWKQPISETVH